MFRHEDTNATSQVFYVVYRLVQKKKISITFVLKRHFLRLVFSLLPLPVFAQDITGTWTGHIQTAGSEVPYEIVITGTKDNFTGYSLTVFTFEGVENIGVKSIKLKNKNKIISIEDDELLYNNYTTPSKRVKLFANLFLKISDSLMIMNGTFATRTIDFRAQDTKPIIGTIRLQKQRSFKPTKLIAMLGEMNLLDDITFVPASLKVRESSAVAIPKPSPSMPQKQSELIIAEKKPEKVVPFINKPESFVLKPVAAAAEIALRKTDIIRQVFFTSDSLVLRIYDNGIVDGDTVSVVLNGNVILSKKALTIKPIETTIQTTPLAGDSLQLILYAENLGSIPPNTGLLVVQDGNEQTTIRFAGDLQKNSAIIFKRKKQ